MAGLFDRFLIEENIKDIHEGIRLRQLIHFEQKYLTYTWLQQKMFNTCLYNKSS